MIYQTYKIADFNKKNDHIIFITTHPHSSFEILLFFLQKSPFDATHLIIFFPIVQRYVGSHFSIGPLKSHPPRLLMMENVLRDSVSSH